MFRYETFEDWHLGPNGMSERYPERSKVWAALKSTWAATRKVVDNIQRDREAGKDPLTEEQEERTFNTCLQLGDMVIPLLMGRELTVAEQHDIGLCMSAAREMANAD